MRVNAPAVLAAVLTAVIGLPAAAATPKVYVAPYAPVHNGVPMALGVKAAKLVADELTAEKKVSVVEGPSVDSAPSAPTARDAHAEAKTIGHAERLASQGDDLMSQLKFKQAASRYKAALTTFEQHLGLLTDFSRLVDIRIDMAVAMFRTHQENAGEHLLADVIAIDPAKKLDPKKYPPLFRRTFDGIRKKLLRLTRGAASVVSTPAGADVILDGRPIGKTPILLKNLVRGRHYVKVLAAGSAPYATVITVSPTEVARVTAGGGGGSVSGGAAPIVAGMVRNHIDSGVLRAAAKTGKSLGANFVILGAIQKGSDAYAVKSWIYDLRKRRLASLPDMSFDFDMLGAAIEVYKVGAKVGSDVTSFPGQVPLPVTCFPGAHAQRVQLAEVDAGPPMPGAAPPPPADTQNTAPPPPEHTSPVATNRGGPVGPSHGGGPVGPSHAGGPVGPVGGGPVMPTRTQPERRRKAAPLLAPAPDDLDDSGSGSAQASSGGPVGPVAEPVKQPPKRRRRRRRVLAVGGPRARLVDTGNDDGSKRYAAVDVDQMVVPKDELNPEPHHGWPWWAWGLLVIGVAGAGAGGFYAADKAGLIGGSATSATVTVTWSK